MKVETTIKKGISTKTLAKIGVLSAIAIVLMLLEFPIPIIAPSFYKLDFSDVPALIGAFSLGPAAGIAIEAIKILLNFIFTGTKTGGVGEIANFIMGIALILPAGIIYKRKKNIKSAIVGLVVSTIALTIVGTAMNYFVLLPAYSLFMPLDKILAMGATVNPMINNSLTFVIIAVAPFNLIKGVLVSIITMLLYKKVSPILHK